MKKELIEIVEDFALLSLYSLAVMLLAVAIIWEY